jgi:hypothetical protein
MGVDLCETKNPSIGTWEWELRREGDRELKRSIPCDLFPGRGQVIQAGLGNWRLIHNLSYE